jgi:hypothetical protein
MPINGCLPLGCFDFFILRSQWRLNYVNNIVPLLCKLDLSEELNKMLIATVRIDNDDLFHPITGYLATDIIQQVQNELRVNDDGALAMARFENLCEYNVGKSCWYSSIHPFGE